MLIVVKEDFEPMATKKTETKKTESKKTTTTTVGRQELTRRVAKQADISQKQAQAALEATLDSIREALQSGNEVRLVGLAHSKCAGVQRAEGLIRGTRSQSRYPQKSVCVSFQGKISQTPSSKRNSQAPTSTGACCPHCLLSEIS